MQRRFLALLIPLVVGVFAAGPVPTHDPDRRIQALDKKIAANPDNGRLYLQRGDYYRQRGDPALALADFDRAAELESDIAEVDLGRARVHLATGRQRRALEEIDRFLTAVPRHGVAWLIRARILNRLDRQREAVDAYDLALQFLKPRSPQHFLERARTQAQLGRVEKAIEGLDEGIDELGPTVSLVNPAIELDIEAGRYDSALQRIERLLETADRRAPWLAWRAEILARADRPLLAEAARRAAVEADDDFSQAHRFSVTPPSAELGMPTMVPATVGGDTFLVSRGSQWRYMDNGSDQGTVWRQRGFNDLGWATGQAELGFGDGNEATLVSFGPDSTVKHTTYYYRQKFQVVDPNQFFKLTLGLVRDDGGVVYLNGTEIGRSQMPAGAINYKTLASGGTVGADESTFFQFDVAPTLLVQGTNVLAAEVHLHDVLSTDTSFDAELLASAPDLSRGPYLQCGTPTSAVIRWRTNAPTETSVWLGTTPNNLVSFSSRRFATDHEVSLTRLIPDTKYFYAIGNRSGIFVGNDADHTFTTSPAPGTAKPTRIWVLGDSGTADKNATAVRDAYMGFTGARETDLILMLGDNAYPFGTDEEYQKAVFDMYPMFLRDTFLWSTLGNHDGVSADSQTESGPYYDIFTFPRLGEAGGLPSGTEAYYSFDYGNIHFICLDSHETDRAVDGAMMQWLSADLANTSAQWIIAFWHHPPYSKGSHDSDSEARLREMREFALPILEEGGVDLVLTGHSHGYERSYLLDGHYGDSSTLAPFMITDKGDGREEGDGAYGKLAPGPVAHDGAVYAVAGSSGWLIPGPFDHPAMFISLASLGSMVLDVDGTRLDARFIDDDGAVQDSFSIIKGPQRALTRGLPRISIAKGGRQLFFLDAGPGNAGKFYQLAGALGTDPGFDMGSVHVPLNVDSWLLTSLSLANTALYNNTLGILNSEGKSGAAFSVPVIGDPAFVGLAFYHAFVVFEAGQISMASNTVKLTFER